MPTSSPAQTYTAAMQHQHCGAQACPRHPPYPRGACPDSHGGRGASSLSRSGRGETQWPSTHQVFQGLPPPGTQRSPFRVLLGSSPGTDSVPVWGWQLLRVHGLGSSRKGAGGPVPCWLGVEGLARVAPASELGKAFACTGSCSRCPGSFLHPCRASHWVCTLLLCLCRLGWVFPQWG